MVIACESERGFAVLAALLLALGLVYFILVCECRKLEQRSPPSLVPLVSMPALVFAEGVNWKEFWKCVTFFTISCQPFCCSRKLDAYAPYPQSNALSTFSLLARLLPSRSRATFCGTVIGPCWLFVVLRNQVGKLRPRLFGCRPLGGFPNYALARVSMSAASCYVRKNYVQ